MNLFKLIGNALKWIAVQLLKAVGKGIQWSARRLWRLSVRGSIYAWHRIRGESGTVVVTLNKQGVCVGLDVYDSKGRHAKTGKPFELTALYRKNYIDGVPDHTVRVYRVNNINSFVKRMGQPQSKMAPQLRFLERLEPESSVQLREEYWKYRNGIMQDNMTADQRVLYDLFSTQQDKLMERTQFNSALASKDADRVLDYLRESMMEQDFHDLNRMISQCEQHASELIAWWPGEKAEALMDLLRQSDPALRQTDPETVLGSVPTDYLTTQQVFYFRCVAAFNQGSDAADKAAGIVNRYDFEKAWAKDGINRFRMADDAGKAALVEQALKVGNYGAVRVMAENLFMGVFNPNDLRSREVYPLTVERLGDAYFYADGHDPLLRYFNEVQGKRSRCHELREAMATEQGFFGSDAYNRLSDELAECNRSINLLYRMDDIIRLEMAKVDNLVHMYMTGLVKGTDGALRPDVADALAALMHNLHEVGYGEAVTDRLNKAKILDSPVLQEALGHYFYSEEDMHRFSGYAAAAPAPAVRQPAPDPQVLQPVAPEVEPARDASRGTAPDLGTTTLTEAKLSHVHDVYGPMVEVDFEDRGVLPFPPSYVEDMMMREPETLQDIIRQVGAEALAYRHGDLTADELAHCPCYEPYFVGYDGGAKQLADRMTEYWTERVVQGVELDPGLPRPELPVSGSEELELSADTPLTLMPERTDEFNKMVDSMVDKYQPHATFEQYCTASCPSEKAVDMWYQAGAEDTFIRLMDEAVAMSMAYRKGEVTPEQLIRAVPFSHHGGAYTKEAVDKVSNRIMGIYEGRIHSTVQMQPEEPAQRRAGGMHR